MEIEQKELESCSFALKISELKRTTSASKLDVLERMSRFEEIRKKKIQEAMEIKKEAENSLMFQPKLLAKRPTTPTQQHQLPFHERLAVPHEKSVSNSAADFQTSTCDKTNSFGKFYVDLILEDHLIFIYHILYLLYDIIMFSLNQLVRVSATSNLSMSAFIEKQKNIARN